MSKILTEVCSTADCGAMIHGEEEIHFRPIRRRPFDVLEDFGHLQLDYAEGLIEDLRVKALAAGWQWDGTQWLCLRCSAMAETVAHALEV